MNISKPSIAVDFDGVIHRYSKGWQDGVIYDPPMEGAKDALEKLSKNFEIIIFTTRLNRENKIDYEQQRKEMEIWLDNYGFKKGVHYIELTGNKPKAKIYLDDRGLRFENWVQAQKDIVRILKD